MKALLIQYMLCAAAILAVLFLAVLAGPGVLVALAINGWLEWENRYRCHCDDGPQSAFAVIGFLVLWVPWLLFLLTIAGESGWLP